MPSKKGKDKYASIKYPRMYRALRRKGMSKKVAAKISNAYMRGSRKIKGFGKKRKGRKKK